MNTMDLLDKRIEHVRQEIEVAKQEIEAARTLFAEHLFLHVANKVKGINSTEFQMKNTRIGLQKEIDALPPLKEELAKLEALKKHLLSEEGAKTLDTLRRELFPELAPAETKDGHG
jgi:SMC interacting uncharacterized protein involved in chromosome segregation